MSLVVNESIGEDNTCVDEYLKRNKQISKLLKWAPPITIVGAPAAGVLGVPAGGLIGATVFASDGWAVLGMMAFGAVYTTAAVVVTFAVLETVKTVQYVSNKRLIKLIASSHLMVDGQEYDKKILNKFTKKYNRKYPVDGMTNEILASAVIELDESAKLCDGSLRKLTNSTKLSKLLARKKDLFAHLHATRQ